MLNSPEFKHQIQLSIDSALQNEDIKKQMADLQKQLQSGELKRQMEQAARALKEAQEQQKRERVH